jgi:hypothetical protein
MSSDLHDRIVTVLLGNWPAPLHGSDKQMKQVDALADEVIAELHLHVEHGRLKVIRYVSDWEINDE